MRMCANVPAQHAIQTALGGYQSVNELIVPGGRFHEQSKLASQPAQRDPRRLVRRAPRRPLLLPAARPRGLPDRERRGVRHRPAARQEDPRHPRHRLQLVRARPLPARHPARRRGAHRGHRPDRRLPRDPAGLTGGRTRARAVDPVVLAAVALGGVIGSLGRYAVGLALPHAAGGFPSATLLVNVTGAFAMGLLVAYLVDRPGAHRLARPFVGRGRARRVDHLLGARRRGGAPWRPATGSRSPWLYVAATFLVRHARPCPRGAVVGQRIWPGP